MTTPDDSMREPVRRLDFDAYERAMAEAWERFPGVTLAEALESVGPGWRALVERAWHIITSAGGRVKQTKEKFAELRVYYDRVPDSAARDVTTAVADIELASGTICEWCGEPGELRDREYEAALPARTDRGTSWWYKTLCDAHAWKFYVDGEKWWSRSDIDG